MTLNERELATVLAALRYWQREGWSNAGEEQEIVSDGGTLTPLDLPEIDDLCERINCDDGKIFVAIYEHRHGSDVCAFATEAAALAWRRQIADQWWTKEFGDKPRPPQEEDLGEVYFEKIDDEFFAVHPTEVET